jgi:hypothetical protein
LFVSVPRLKPVTLASNGKQGCVICRKVCSEPRFYEIHVVNANVLFFEVFVSYKYPSATKTQHEHTTSRTTTYYTTRSTAHDHRCAHDSQIQLVSYTSTSRHTSIYTIFHTSHTSTPCLQHAVAVASSTRRSAEAASTSRETCSH